MEIRLKFTIRAMRLSLSLKPLKLGSWFHVKRNQQKKPQKEDASHSVFGNLAQSPIRPIPIPNPLVGSFSSGLDPMTHPQPTFVLGASGIFADRTKERPKSYKPMTKASRAKGKSSTRGKKPKNPRLTKLDLKLSDKKISLNGKRCSRKFLEHLAQVRRLILWIGILGFWSLKNSKQVAP